MDSNALLRVCWDKVWKDFGVPRIIISDRGPQFTYKIMQAHNKGLGIDTPEGQDERPAGSGTMLIFIPTHPGGKDQKIVTNRGQNRRDPFALWSR